MRKINGNQTRSYMTQIINIDWRHKFLYNVVREHTKLLYGNCNPHLILLIFVCVKRITVQIEHILRTNFRLHRIFLNTFKKRANIITYLQRILKLSIGFMKTICMILCNHTRFIYDFSEIIKRSCIASWLSYMDRARKCVLTCMTSYRIFV